MPPPIKQIRLRWARSVVIGAVLPLVAGCLVRKEYELAILREYALHAYDEGLRFREQGNVTVALDRFSRSTILLPSPAGYFQMARAYEVLAEPREAALAYAAALELAPDFQEARFGLLSLGFAPPSEVQMKADPELYEAFRASLEEEIRMRRLEEAEAGTTEMTEEERDALRERIRARMELAEERRLPTLEEVRAVIFTGEGEAIPSATDPVFAGDRGIILDTYPYHFANGQRLQRNQEYEKAAVEYQNAIDADPERMEARTNLGDVMMRLERHQEAFQHYTLAMEQFPDSPVPLLKLGNYYSELEREDLAREYYQRSLSIDPEYVEALNNLAAIDIRNREFGSAISRLRRATELDPTYALAWLNVGVALENSGDRTGAVEAYRRYVDLGGERSAEVRGWIAELE